MVIHQNGEGCCKNILRSYLKNVQQVITIGFLIGFVFVGMVSIQIYFMAEFTTWKGKKSINHVRHVKEPDVYNPVIKRIAIYLLGIYRGGCGEVIGWIRQRVGIFRNRLSQSLCVRGYIWKNVEYVKKECGFGNLTLWEKFVQKADWFTKKNQHIGSVILKNVKTHNPVIDKTAWASCQEQH